MRYTLPFGLPGEYLGHEDASARLQVRFWHDPDTQIKKHQIVTFSPGLCGVDPFTFSIHGHLTNDILTPTLYLRIIRIIHQSETISHALGMLFESSKKLALLGPPC